MGLHKIGFWEAAVNYDDHVQAHSFWKGLANISESALCLSGRRVNIISGYRQNGIGGGNLIESPTHTTTKKIIHAILFIVCMPMIPIKAYFRWKWPSYIIGNANDPSKKASKIKIDSHTLQNREKLQQILPYKELQQAEKEKINTICANPASFALSFIDHPHIFCTIRDQNLFDSGAQSIVNAANTHLGGGGGIDGAIHKKGGLSYQKAHQKLKEKYSGSYTSGYAECIESGELAKMHNIKKVIVVVGPQGPDANQEKNNQLYSCYYNSLLTALNNRIESIALPSISTGIYNYPLKEAAHIARKAIFDFLNDHPDTFLKTISIHFCSTLDSQDGSRYAQFIAAMNER